MTFSVCGKRIVRGAVDIEKGAVGLRQDAEGRRELRRDDGNVVLDAAVPVILVSIRDTNKLKVFERDRQRDTNRVKVFDDSYIINYH